MQVEIFSSLNDFVSASVGVIESAYSAGGRFFALAGGNTPLPVYESLVKSKEVDFSKIHFFVLDERYVPYAHEDSNYRRIQKSLFDVVSTHAHGFDTELSIEESLSTYEKEIQDVVENQFDLVVLGIGSDGHIASLFPGSDGLFESDHSVAHTTTDTLAVHDRLTMTFPVIMKSKQILVLLRGEQKKAILEEVIDSDSTIAELPAKALLHHPNVIVYLLDN